MPVGAAYAPLAHFGYSYVRTHSTSDNTPRTLPIPRGAYPYRSGAKRRYKDTVRYRTVSEDEFSVDSLKL
jgi:hypothetical protein